jgi:predicted Zn finger-like uncharacterized protein
MIIVCQRCTSRFQVDDAKIPAGPFTVRCPKCHETVSSSAELTTYDKGAFSIGKSPASSSGKYERSVPAPLFRASSSAIDDEAFVEPTKSLPGAGDQARALLSSLLETDESAHKSKTRPSWNRRRVLVCTAPVHRETIASGLSENGYEAFVAEDTQQAIERMRQSQLDVVILDSDFDTAEQGAAFVTREINVLRPAERRRLFFVSLSSSKRTMDKHAAFIQNVNLSVNFGELADLPDILDQTMREFNALYKPFYIALNLSPL